MSRARDIANYGDGIDTSSITSGTLADARIPDLSASKITSGTFATARIADDAINLDKLAHLGTDGQVLTSTGTGSAPAFETPSGGTTSYSFVSYTQVPSPDNQTFTIDNVFTDSYKCYRVIISSIIGASNMDTSVVNFRFLDNSGSQLTGAVYHYVAVSRDSNNNDRNIQGASTSSANMSQNFGAESSKKQALCADLLFTGTRTDSMYTRCEGTLTHDYGTDALVVATFSASYRATGSVRGFALLGGGSSNHWTQNSDGGVYVYGINHA